MYQEPYPRYVEELEAELYDLRRERDELKQALEVVLRVVTYATRER